ERFVGKKSSQIHNYVLLGIFIVVHAYYTHVEPILLARSLNFSVATMIFTFQCCWLLLRRVDSSMRRITFTVGIVFGCYVVASFARIILLTLSPPQSSDFFKIGTVDTLAMVVYIMLTAALTLSLILMVNRRLLGEIQTYTDDLEARTKEYQRLVETTNVGIASANTAGELTFVNEGLCSMLGYSQGELLGKPFIEFVHPQDRDNVVQSFLRAFTNPKGTLDFELAVVHKDGTIRHAYAHVAHLKSGDQTIGFNAILTDITERKQAKEALKESEERYRFIAENMTDTVWLMDMNLQATWVSPSGERISGYSAEEIKEMSFDKLITPKSLEIALKAIAENLAEEKLARKDLEIRYTAELEFVRKDGSTYWSEIQTTVLRNDQGVPFSILGVGRDITERKQAEQALKASEEKHRDLVENLANVIYTLDTQGNITYMSPALERISQYRVSELIGQNFSRFVYPDDLPELITSFQGVLAGQLQPSEYRLVDKDGSIKWVRSSSRPQIEDGIVIGVTGILTDITEHKAMLQHLVLTDRLAALGDMAGGFAHELNNPLSSVMGYAQLLLDRKDLPADVRNDIELIYKDSRRAANIIKNFMVFARKQPPQRQPTDVNSLIQDILNLRQHEQTKSNIAVKIKFGKLPPVEVDQSQIRQVFLNIIINAEYFMSKANRKGTLTITTRKSGNMVTASFADDGPGIPAEQLDHVFDPFFTTKEVGQGTGLGLSICHGIVTEHGGRIYAQSQEGKGATFVVELPIAK
ncbi:MAG: PAS domain S-box protein, partial [Chloroflexi bacterium]|nr:PAS domain S-box protein [Chloroflexota bacterium]